MRKIIYLATGVIVSASLLGCGNGVTNQGVGRVSGGIIGGLLGSQVGKGSGRTAAIIGGTLLGSTFGANIGKSMDDVNRMKMARALEATKTNHAYVWTDTNGRRFTVVPTNSYTSSNNQICRRYKMSVVIDGKLQHARGTACRDARGNWVIM